LPDICDRFLLNLDEKPFRIVFGPRSQPFQRWVTTDVEACVTRIAKFGRDIEARRAFKVLPANPLPDHAGVGQLGININKLVKKRDICARYNVSSRTVENWMASGVLPYVKISYGIVRFDPEACDEAISRFHRNRPTASA
jgi:hypothetical protein